jgi:lipopolysaccharide transport system permease protein
MAMREYFHELRAHLPLVVTFARRDVRARYRQTAFGVAWAIIQPFSLMVVFTAVFSKFARVPSDGIPYPIFAYSALIFWMCFATSVSQGTMAMVANANLVRKIYFPRETLLLAVLLSTGMDLLVASGIFVGMLAYYGVGLTWAALWVLPLFAIQELLTLGVICMTSAVEVHFRDIGHALPLALQLWMFATPVAYPLSLVPEWLLPLYHLNPMATVIDGYRRVLLLGDLPDLMQLWVSLGVAMVLLSVAYFGFKRAERTFADVI